MAGTTRTAAPAARKPLTGCRVAFAGTFGGGVSQAALQRDVLALGGEVERVVGSETTHLVTTDREVQKGTRKVQDAMDRGGDVKVVGAEWLRTCLEEGKRADEDGFLIGDREGGSVSQSADVKKEAKGTNSSGKRPAAAVAASAESSDAEAQAPPKKLHKTEAKTQSKLIPDTANTKPKKQINIPIDEGCALQTYQVYVDPMGVIYDAALNMTNATGNNNKFYRIQLLHDPSRDNYKTWTRWGRVGEHGQSAVLGGGSLKDALKQFDKKFKDKSGMKWDDRSNDPRPGKYAFIERNYASDSEDEDEDVSKAGAATKKEAGNEKLPPECTLDKPIQDLLGLIFNQQYFAATMSDLNYDANKLPLGKLSKTTIRRGFQALKDLAALLDHPALAGSTYGLPLPEAIEHLSNLYYTLIPHDFGRNRPPVIRSPEMLKKEVELLESLSDIKDAALVIKVEKQGSTADTVHPMDRQFQQLGMDEMAVLDERSAEFAELAMYLQNTRGHTHGIKYDIQNIFRIQRHGEKHRLDAVKWNVKGSDRRLLWHSSQCTNFGGILSQGLRIAPPEAPVSGYMFGKGIYLADMSSKSANYCASYVSGGHALLLLCEAELGKPMQELTQAQYDAGESAREKGCLSTWGKGMTGPEVWKDAGCLEQGLKGVLMPDVTKTGPGPTNVDGAYLQYNEYICYDVAQVRLRYLFRVKM